MDFVVELGKWFVIAYLIILLGRAVAARIAGNNAQLVLGSSLITISLPALPRRSSDDDQESDEETGNTETPEYAGNTEETAGETPYFDRFNDLGEQRLVPKMSRDEYHEFVAVRVRAIDLLQRCVKYYADNQMSDNGIIPRYDKIGMKSQNRQDAVNDLWYSQYIVKAPNVTSVDPAYYPTCGTLMQAIIDKQARVYPLGYLERKKALRDAAFNALPENDRND